MAKGFSINYGASLRWDDPDGQARHWVRALGRIGSYALSYAELAATMLPAPEAVTTSGSVTTWSTVDGLCLAGSAWHVIDTLGDGPGEPLLLAPPAGALASSYDVARAKCGKLMNPPPLRWTELIPTVTGGIVEVTIEVADAR